MHKLWTKCTIQKRKEKKKQEFDSLGVTRENVKFRERFSEAYLEPCQTFTWSILNIKHVKHLHGATGVKFVQS